MGKSKHEYISEYSLQQKCQFLQESSFIQNCSNKDIWSLIGPNKSRKVFQKKM